MYTSVRVPSWVWVDTLELCPNKRSYALVNSYQSRWFQFSLNWTLYAPPNGHILVWNWLKNWSERSNFFHLEYYIVYFCKCTPLGLNKLVRPLLDDLKTKFRCGPIPSLTVSVIVKLQFANFRLPLGFGEMPSCLVNRKNTHWIT